MEEEKMNVCLIGITTSLLFEFIYFQLSSLYKRLYNTLSCQPRTSNIPRRRSKFQLRKCSSYKHSI